MDNTPKTTVQNAPALTGLTTAEVAERLADGRVNDVPDAPVRTTSKIFRANVLTPINAIMGALFALILVAGFPGDALFAGVIVSNSIIGTVQELRARRTLTNLAVLSAPGARVVRDGTAIDIDVSSVVSDDLLELRPGDQVVVDGVVVDALGLEVDESLLTGEADPVDKTVGDRSCLEASWRPARGTSGRQGSAPSRMPPPSPKRPGDSPWSTASSGQE